MFVLDDIILAPAKGFLWIARELQKAAEKQQADDRDALMRRLQSLHMRLETGDLTEAEFEAAEAEILDRLDAMDGNDIEPDDDDDEPAGVGVDDLAERDAGDDAEDDDGDER